MTRTVTDAALLLGGRERTDADDVATRRQHAKKGPRDYTKSPDTNGWKARASAVATGCLATVRRRPNRRSRHR